MWTSWISTLFDANTANVAIPGVHQVELLARKQVWPKAMSVNVRKKYKIKIPILRGF